MVLDREEGIPRVMFLRRQSEMRWTIQMEEEDFARSTDISSMGRGQKAKHTIPVELNEMWLWEFWKKIFDCFYCLSEKEKGDHLVQKIRDKVSEVCREKKAHNVHLQEWKSEWNRTT